MPKAKRKSKPQPRPRKHRSLKRRFIFFCLKIAIAACMLWSVVALAYYGWALTFDLAQISAMPQRSAVYDREGKLYSRLAGENRIVVRFDKISNDFVNALLAREDRRFYWHHGIDPIGIARAIVRNLFLGGFREGASTLTQQLARNSFPLGGKNFHRKFIEAALAYRIETELTKEEIMAAYMNRIYFGSGNYGFETASQAYFGKSAARMNLPEAAMLAGLIRSPNRFSPFNNLEKAVRERDSVLRSMRDVGFITEARMQAAIDSPPTLRTKPRSSPQNNWAMESILSELDLVLDRDDVEEGGLKILTTIDGPLQNLAERSVSRRLEQIEFRQGFPHRTMKSFAPADILRKSATPYLEAAAIALDSDTGGIRAIVGGRDYARSKFNRALHGRRQVGSAVKPFIYAKAFEAGIKPEDRVNDNRLRPGELPRKYGNYDPANSDKTYRGELPASEGLVLSRNTMTVRLGLRTGLDEIADTLIQAGLSPNPPRLPALCLGAFETTLKDLTASYTAFANGGVRCQPYLIDRVVDADGRTLYKATRGKIRIFTPESSARTVSLMEEVLTRGTGAKARQYGLHHRAAGKTGTTNNFQDAWFVGFDSKLTCGVWVGFDLPRKIMTGGTGAELALPIWVDIMEAKAPR